MAVIVKGCVTLAACSAPKFSVKNILKAILSSSVSILGTKAKTDRVRKELEWTRKESDMAQKRLKRPKSRKCLPNSQPNKPNQSWRVLGASEKNFTRKMKMWTGLQPKRINPNST